MAPKHAPKYAHAPSPKLFDEEARLAPTLSPKFFEEEARLAKNFEEEARLSPKH